jgi:transporter family-2 protein
MLRCQARADAAFEESRTMMANYWPHLLAMLVGGALTVQVGMNATLARVIGSPLWAAAVSFVVGLLALVAFAVVAGSRASTGSFGQVPAWAWMGGLLGAVYVASVTILGPRLGGMTMVALVIAGQLTVALVVDQFGILGYPQIAVTPTRLLGAALLLAGAVLVIRR